MAQRGQRHLQHVVASTGNVEQGSEQHEQKDELHRHTQRHTVHPFSCQPHVRDETRQRRPPVLDHIGHVGAEKHKGHEQPSGHQHAKTHGPARGLQHDGDTHHTHDNVHGGGQAWSERELVIKQKQVSATKSAHQRQQPVRPGNHAAR